MSESSLSGSVERALISSGWIPGRTVDITPYIACWDRRGILMNAAAMQFCREFGGLKIHHSPHVEIAGAKYSDFTFFDVVYAVDGISDRSLDEFSRLAQERLCPVGSNRSHMTVMIAPSGKVFAGVDNYLFLVGSNPIEALTSICEGSAMYEVGEWHAD